MDGEMEFLLLILFYFEWMLFELFFMLLFILICKQTKDYIVGVDCEWCISYAR